MEMKRIKVILSITLLTLIISLGTCVILTEKDENKKLHNSFLSTIITKQPNLKTIVENEEAKRKAKEENERKVLEEKKKAEEEAKRKALEEKKKALEEDKKEEEKKKKNEAEAKKNAEAKKAKKETTEEKEQEKTTNNNKNSTTTTNNTTTTNCEKGSNYQKQLLCYVNKERTSNGLKSLTLDTNLNNSASIRAKEIKTSFSHTRPNGNKFNTAITISYNATAENIAAGQSSAKEVFNAWMNSDGHRKNILSSKYTKMGIALHKDTNSEYKYYWAQLFIG